MKIEDKCIIAIDPGREKCGIAVLTVYKKTILHKIVHTSELLKEITYYQKKYVIDTAAVGNGTTSKEVQTKLEKEIPQLKLNIVNEYRTTDEAKKRYWQENPPRGIKKLIPRGMLVPPVPVDDFAAVIIGEKYLLNV